MAESIRILETDNKRKGNLLGRLAADVFVALGYEYPRLNIAKSGREVDFSALHRYEPRRAVGECKATADPVGGDDLNKFAGVVDVEFEPKVPVTGYFISLSGFTGTALEQEKQRRRTTIVTLTGSQVVETLVNGNIIISRDRASDLAGRCCAAHAHLTIDAAHELLAHEKGWIRCIYYTQGKARSHYVLLHADGTVLGRTIVDEVVAADRECDGTLHELTCLNPAPATHGTEGDLREALAAHREYLLNECGFLYLDGLPADTEVGSRRLRLESLFVPLTLAISAPGDEKPQTDDNKVVQLPVGATLATHPRLAVLSPPGAGKSTLLKRLATVYADPQRRGDIGDDLPDRPWLPLFFRCRELRGLARGSFADLLHALSQREPIRRHAAVFRAHVDRELVGGRVLLLVDGLDEISDPGDRAAFVCTLRAVLQAYPGVSIVLTSREAGYRHVASHLTSTCTRATLAPFDDDAIRRLTVDWHRETIADTEKVRADALQLAETIIKVDRIRRLAVNPLLLTTLLLVKRWVGSLPTRRAALYGKAVEMLLMTWNIEGHAPIPEDEALPQLCYVASAMMIEKVQKISRPRLAKLLHEAREALPTELGYVQGTVEHFINRVEERSSVLMMSGHDIEDGRLVEFFEFRHLTFQEFLTARALVEGWHRDRPDDATLVSVLAPFFDREDWGEVIPLAAALGGKAAEKLLEELTTQLSRVDKGSSPSLLFLALARCLADETPARPDIIRSALHQLVRFGDMLFRLPRDITLELLRGRYGPDCRTEASSQYLQSKDDDLLDSGLALVATSWHLHPELLGNGALSAHILALINSPELNSRCEGAYAVVGVCLSGAASRLTESRDITAALGRMLFSELAPEIYAADWALGVLGLRGEKPVAPEPDVLARLFELWDPQAPRRSQAIPTFGLPRQPLNFGARKQRLNSASRIALKKALREHTRVPRYEEVVLDLAKWYLGETNDLELYQRVQQLKDAAGQTGVMVHVYDRLLEQLAPRLPLDRSKGEGQAAKKRKAPTRLRKRARP